MRCCLLQAFVLFVLVMAPFASAAPIDYMPTLPPWPSVYPWSGEVPNEGKTLGVCRSTSSYEYKGTTFGPFWPCEGGDSRAPAFNFLYCTGKDTYNQVFNEPPFCEQADPKLKGCHIFTDQPHPPETMNLVEGRCPQGTYCGIEKPGPDQLQSNVVCATPDAFEECRALDFTGTVPGASHCLIQDPQCEEKMQVVLQALERYYLDPFKRVRAEAEANGEGWKYGPEKADKMMFYPSNKAADPARWEAYMKSLAATAFSMNKNELRRIFCDENDAEETARVMQDCLEDPVIDMLGGPTFSKGISRTPTKVEKQKAVSFMRQLADKVRFGGDKKGLIESWKNSEGAFWQYFALLNIVRNNVALRDSGALFLRTQHSGLAQEVLASKVLRAEWEATVDMNPEWIWGAGSTTRKVVEESKARATLAAAHEYAAADRALARLRVYAEEISDRMLYGPADTWFDEWSIETALSQGRGICRHFGCALTKVANNAETEDLALYVTGNDDDDPATLTFNDVKDSPSRHGWVRVPANPAKGIPVTFDLDPTYYWGSSKLIKPHCTKFVPVLPPRVANLFEDI